MASNELFTQLNEPWWAKHRDKVFLLAFVLLLGAGIGIVPSPVTRGIDKLLTEHAGIADKLTVQCVHDADMYKDQAIRSQKQLECVTGQLYDINNAKNH